MKRLIFNADDYGLSPGVCRGILDAAGGVVRSTTVMANLASPADLAALTASQLSCGVHLNLSCGRPLTAAFPSRLLDSEGLFDKQLALDAATWQAAGACDAALAEWQAQLQLLLDCGIKPTHLDSHHHTHLLPGLFPAAMQLARRLHAGLRTGDDSTRRQARQAGISNPDYLVVDFFGNNCIGRAALLYAIGRAQGDAVEVMCHPGKVDALLQQRSSYVAEREQELATLNEPGLAAELEALGWQLADYNVLNGDWSGDT